MGDTNQLKQRGTYNKVLLKTKAKSLRRVNINKRYKRYKDFY